MISEFKDFINNGGVFETAVGLIMALAFAPVVTGMVEHLLMPIIARIFGQPDLGALKIGLGGEVEVENPDGTTSLVEPAIAYGEWLNLVIGFLMVALVMFFLVKAYNNAQDPEPEEEDGPSAEDLLTEIRDSLARG